MSPPRRRMRQAIIAQHCSAPLHPSSASSALSYCVPDYLDGGMDMANPTFSIARRDEAMTELVSKTDQGTLARWALACAKRVIPYFEHHDPLDHRPQHALETLKIWIDTRVFKM